MQYASGILSVSGTGFQLGFQLPQYVWLAYTSHPGSRQKIYSLLAILLAILTQQSTALDPDHVSMWVRLHLTNRGRDGAAGICEKAGCRSKLI
jgi:hypothetical protein